MQYHIPETSLTRNIIVIFTPIPKSWWGYIPGITNFGGDIYIPVIPPASRRL